MLYKNNLIKVGDNLKVIYYVPYFIKGKERLIIRNFTGICVKRYATRNTGEVIKLNAWFKRNLITINFNLTSPLLIKLVIIN
jgi:hypothetical protein